MRTTILLIILPYPTALTILSIYYYLLLSLSLDSNSFSEKVSWVSHLDKVQTLNLHQKRILLLLHSSTIILQL